ncbi:TLR4 interactor with leucine rich repeats-like [Lampris incognitus]|uniref:TLR4 interactor with leucine rich repeats-like n=1 Tax=Lampris incognitus TaxID=2546036 RepID=UPI0024B55A02|nr:TLR4 interactor with leucine rich repeats-like [Lampris incognitus]
MLSAVGTVRKLLQVLYSESKRRFEVCLSGLYADTCCCDHNSPIAITDGNFSTSVSDFPYNTEYLDLSRNLLTALPPGSFGALWGLKVLLLKENNITFVSDRAFINLWSLQRLDLSQNQLSALGEGFSLGLNSLFELFLAHNRLTVLESKTLQNLDNLVKLDLSANLIELVKPGALSSLTALRRLLLDGNQLTTLDLELLSTLHSLEVLGLRGNRIHTAEQEVFAPLSNLALLDLGFNRLSRLHFKTLLSIQTASVHILLEANPWHCDCDLQRVFHKLATIRRLFLDDYKRLRCSQPKELRGSLMVEVDNELCVGETVTVLILTFTVLITVVAAIIMGEKKKRKCSAKDRIEETLGLEAYCDN